MQRRLALNRTIVSLLDERPVLLRPGGLPRESIEACLGAPLPDADASDGAEPRSPGRLASHYAPRASVRLDASGRRAGEAALDFGGTFTDRHLPYADLSPAGDLVEAAARLYACLRALTPAERMALPLLRSPRTALAKR